MELEVGMYVRFLRANETYIRKITSFYHKTIQNQTILIFDKSFRYSCWSTAEKNVLKASHNIIDLIEVGDYVNGCLVEKKFPEVEYAEQSIKLKGSTDYFYDIHIKSIVTKEQFESMEYKL